MTEKKIVFKWFLVIFGIGLCIIMYGTVIKARDIKRIDVVSPRPLSDAIKCLESALDCRITYEDPHLKYPPEIREMFEGGPLVLQKGKISFQYNPKETPEVIIKELLAEHQRQANAGVFKLAVGPGQIYNVIPVKTRNREGNLVPNQSILDANLSFSAEDLDYQSIIDKICDLLPRTKDKLTLGFGPCPLPVLYQNRGSVSWVNEEARSCLNEVLLRVDKRSRFKWSWKIYGGPVFLPWGLNFYTISPLPSGPCQMRIVAGRPLAEAISILEERFQCTITYEDTLYIWPWDTLRNRAGELEVPRGGIIYFSYSTDSDPSEVIQSCLTAYHREGINTGVFTMKKMNNVYHVFPIKSKNEEGRLDPHQSILDTCISVCAKDKTPVEILTTICATLTENSNTHVVVGKTPADILSQPHKSYEAVNQPARVCLTEFLKGVSDNLSWQLFYDPKSKGYILNVHQIPKR